MTWGIKGVYIVELKNGKYYVGESQNIGIRLLDHLTRPSGIVKRYKYRKLVRYYEMPNSSRKEREIKENAITLSLMDKYEIENVYGGIFTTRIRRTLKNITFHKKK